MDLASAFAIGTDLPGSDGKVYKLRKPTIYEQGLFQRWLEQRAHDAIDRGPESEEAKAKRHDRVYVDSALGKYEYDGQYALESLWEPPGLAKITCIICRDQGMTDEVAEATLAKQIRLAAAVILRKSIDDPKAVAGILQALGFPADFLAEMSAAPPSEPSSNSSSTPPSTEPSPNSDAAPTTSSCSSTTSSGPTTG